MVFQAIEDYLETLGHSGRACLLRAICETNEQPLDYHGLAGEMLQLLFSVSRSPYAEETLPDHLAAETAGREGATGKEGATCVRYHSDCPFSLFSSVSDNKRRRAAAGLVPEENNLYTGAARTERNGV